MRLLLSKIYGQLTLICYLIQLANPFLVSLSLFSLFASWVRNRFFDGERYPVILFAETCIVHCAGNTKNNKVYTYIDLQGKEGATGRRNAGRPFQSALTVFSLATK